MSFLGKLFGIKDANLKVVAKIQPMVDQVNQLEAEFQALTDEELRNKTEEFRKNLKEFEKNSKELNKEKEALEQILPVAFAAVREANRRAIKIRHFDVQLVGGVVLHRGEIAEMKTGEGKTHVAALALYLNALAGKGAHLITVNDYLAKRDAAWNGPANHLLGMKTACIIHNVALVYDPEYAAENQSDEKLKHMRPCKRKEAYEADITYGTNSEFGFDYLRDNMASTTADQVQRPLYYAIVDEVDSVLIDEARTPLIISAPAEESADLYTKFAQIVPRLKENVDYNVDEKMRAATLSEAGLNNIEKILGLGNIYNEGGIQMVHHLEQALNAHALYKRDKDYVVQNDEVIIIDEFTGRLMQGRRYSEGLHQAIEAKEGVSVQKESRTLATITIQNYFRLYKKLAGMTGTAVTEAEEFGKIYKLEVVVVPTSKPGRRIDHPDRIYKTEMAKYKAIAKLVKELQEKGQPVLIGTVSVDKNETLSEFLSMDGVKHEILNAKNHEREGEIIAQAGRSGRVTLATNMAGRGVDIILGGNPPDLSEAEKVKSAGGLFVLGTERHESRRIDNQLRGRSGRQGDSGESQFFLSTEDDLMRIFAGDRIKSVMTTLRVPEDMPIEQKMITNIIKSAQKKVEGMHFDTRKHLLEYDDVLNRHREVIYGKRKKILESFKREKEELNSGTARTYGLRAMILEYVEQEIEQVVSFHTNAEDTQDWNMREIYETMMTVFPLSVEQKEIVLGLGKKAEDQATRMDEAGRRTKIIEYLNGLAKEKYEDLLTKKIPQPELMLEIEKQVLLRGIDNLWVEHLVAVDYLRTGIGLRGYGQRDPLVEYKKETYRMFNELLSLIQKEVVYLIYKVNLGIKLAPTMMNKDNLILKGAEKTSDDHLIAVGKKRDAEGHKVGR